MKEGVGRLLLTSELTDRGTITSEAVRRTAFVIDRMHALTAWHCAQDTRDGADALWLRLTDLRHIGIDEVDVPVVVVDTDTALDAAVLALDRSRKARGALDDDLDSLFASVALPLGETVPVHAQIRTEGFPRDARPGGLAFAGLVVDSEAKLSRSRALQLHLAELGATVPHGPGGHSGGPVLFLDPGSEAEVVVGLVRSFPPDESHEYAIGGTVLATRIQDLVKQFSVVKDAQSRLQLFQRSVRDQDLPTKRHKLTPDVCERYRPQLVAAIRNSDVDVGFAWGDHEEMSYLKDVLNAKLFDGNDQALRKPAELATALVDALDAKDALDGIEVADVALGRLQRLYYQEIGDWPRHGTSYDAMLVEAALVSISRRRRNQGDSLSPLARFLLTVVAECEPRAALNRHAIINWLQKTGHQLADARAHLDLRSTRSVSWLLIDLGPESPTESLAENRKSWPSLLDLSATLFTQGADTVSVDHTDDAYEQTEAGLLKWLQGILRRAHEFCGSEGDLVVDIAAPHSLLEMGIERWCLIDIDGKYEPLTDHCQPRLRWSQRHRVDALRRAALRRAEQLIWANDPAFLPPEASDSNRALKDWLFNVRQQPWLLCGQPTISSKDVLKTLLREGCPYIVWHRNQVSVAQTDRLTSAASCVPPAARQSALPETIRRESPSASPPVIVWDDPMGRDCHVLRRTRLQGPGG